MINKNNNTKIIFQFFILFSKLYFLIFSTVGSKLYFNGLLKQFNSLRFVGKLSKLVN
jgi:hypothetical protein